MNSSRTIYHGLPRDLLRFRPNAGGYLAFLRRIAPETRPDRAIIIAARSGMPLKIAAKVDRVDQAYWEEKTRPMVDAIPTWNSSARSANVTKRASLAACALLFPNRLAGAFRVGHDRSDGMRHAVIAFRRGSVPEIVDEGVLDSCRHDRGGSDSFGRIANMDRGEVRGQFECRFTAERMARGYLDIYRKLLSARSTYAYFDTFNRSVTEGVQCGLLRSCLIPRDQALPSTSRPQNASFLQ